MDNNKKTLIAFDFDQTIIDEESTSKLINLLNNPVFHETDLHLKHFRSKWVVYLQDLFKRLNSENVSTKSIQEIFESLRWVNEIDSLFKYLSENLHLYEIIIISGSNVLFISWFVQYHKLPVKFIIAQQATVVESDLIKIWTEQTDTCNKCPDYCKRIELENYIKNNNINYNRLIYIGDGANDLCPSRLLNQDDYLFVRKNFQLFNILKSVSIEDRKLMTKGKIHFWEKGREILEEIKKIKH